MTGSGGLIMGSVFNQSLIVILGSVNLALASFIGIRYLQSTAEKEKK